MKSFSFSILVIGLLAFLFSCSTSTTNSQQETVGSEAETPVNENQWPQPTSRINGIPIYDKFEDIEPFFHFDNDTTYVINFWATWCKPCVEELPYFETFTEKYKGEKVQVILVSLDFPKKIESKLVPFVEEHQLQSDVLVLLDGKYNNWIDKVSPEWEGAIPVTYIYKKDKIHFIASSIESEKELEEVVNGMSDL